MVERITGMPGRSEDVGPTDCRQATPVGGIRLMITSFQSKECFLFQAPLEFYGISSGNNVGA